MPEAQAQELQEEPQEEVEINPLEMSDEDIMNAPEPTDEVEASEPDDDEGTVEGTVDNVGEGQEAPAEDTDNQQQEVIAENNPTSDNATDTEITTNDEQEQENAGEETKENTDKKAQDVITPDAQLAALYSPFKANGKEMSVTSIDDARTLMQMGANYNKKMAGLKPNLKLMKMLDNNGLLDESKLSYLIDLSNKNPEAIAKLVSDSGVDPLEIDTEKSSGYVPNTYTVGDKDIELDQVLKDIEDTPTFNKTIDIITTKWDTTSKNALLDTPTLIANINDHMASGVYDQISYVVEQERTLGRLTELSDLEAYEHVGNVLKANGAFDKQAAPNEQAPTQVAAAPTQQTKPQDPKLNTKRRAASGTKATKTTGSTNYNPLTMSDDDFMKMASPI